MKNLETIKLSPQDVAKAWLSNRGMAKEWCVDMIDTWDNSEIEICYSIGFHGNGTTGYYEFYDSDTAGNEHYGEGYLEFTGIEFTGYDGCFCIPFEICKKLQEMGFDCTEMMRIERD